MKKMLFTVATALTLVAVPAAVVSAQGNGYRNGEGSGDQIQQRIHDPAQDQDKAQDQTRQRLHDGSGENHANCDGNGTGDMHRYGAER